MSNYLKNRLNCFDPNNMNNESCKCSICLNPPSESSIETNCGHFYHQECLDRWFSTINKNICPLCKKEVNYMVNADGTKFEVTNTPLPMINQPMMTPEELRNLLTDLRNEIHLEQRREIDYENEFNRQRERDNEEIPNFYHNEVMNPYYRESIEEEEDEEAEMDDIMKRLHERNTKLDEDIRNMSGKTNRGGSHKKRSHKKRSHKKRSHRKRSHKKRSHRKRQRSRK